MIPDQASVTIKALEYSSTPIIFVQPLQCDFVTAVKSQPMRGINLLNLINWSLLPIKVVLMSTLESF